jgi:hypothetical protein
MKSCNCAAPDKQAIFGHSVLCPEFPDLPGRAIHALQKQNFMDRLLKAWLEVPELRFGQFMEAARCNFVLRPGLFMFEDESLVEAAEALAREYTAPSK